MNALRLHFMISWRCVLRMTLLVVLDLNGVLLDSTHTKRPSIAEDAKARHKFVYYRPGMRDFISWIMANPAIRVGIWTSNIRANADALVELIFTPDQRRKLAFVFSRDECLVFPDYTSQKPAQRVFSLGYDPRHTLFIDDSPEKVVHPLKHLFYVPVKTFEATAGLANVDVGIDFMQRIIQARLLLLAGEAANPNPGVNMPL